jgi:hypothetical protein
VQALHLGGVPGGLPDRGAFRTEFDTVVVQAVSAGAAAVLAGSMGERWAVYKAGFQSARDPRYIVEPQRARLVEREREQPGQ